MPGDGVALLNDFFRTKVPGMFGFEITDLSRERADGRLTVTEPLARLEAWDTWWARAAHDPALAAAMDERRTVFPTSYPAEEFSPPAGWPVASLRAAGFTEATVTWRSGHAAVVTGLR